MAKPIGFTPNQQLAIDFKDGNCLVSAGAGSGKTAVLTERVYWLIVPPLDPGFAESYKKEYGVEWSPDHKDDKGQPLREPIFLEGASPLCSPDELLVLTFTKAAAYEMKTRVREKLAAYSCTSGYLEKIEQSDITNFDSFYLKTVNENHFELGLPNKVKILDTAFVEVKTRELIDESLAYRYSEFNKTHDPFLLDIYRRFTGKDDESLVSIVKGVLNLASLSGDEDSFFSNYEETYFSDAYIDRALNSYVPLIRRKLNCLLPLIKYPNNPEAESSDRNYLSSIISAPTFEAMQLAASEGKFITAKGLDEMEKKLRNKVKADAKPYLSVLVRGKEGIEAELSQIKPYVHFFLEIAKEVYTRREAYMKEHSSYDFEGVARLMRELLSHTDFRERFRKKYRYIMVDEYQDTSNAQEEFLKAVSSDNVFAVGDIKQSIYRFRKANPKVFAKKMEDYGKGKGGTLITLPDNFRSREEVLSDINRLFGKIMSSDVGGVDYRLGHALRFGNHGFDATSNREKFGIHVLNFEEVIYEKTCFSEAKWIARDIAKKVKEGFTLKGKKISKDGKKETKYECGYGDFAILTSRKVDFGQYIRAFREEGVPLSVIDSYKVDNDDVVLVFKSLLRILVWMRYGEMDKASLDSAYIGIARSFLFAIDDDRVYDIYGHVKEDDDYSFFPFHKTLSHIASRLDSLTLEELFLLLIEEFKVMERLVELKDVELNFQKIEKLSNLASSLEDNGFGLREFVEYLDKLRDNDIELEIEGGAREKDAVVLMSDHASKGLQFPICYYPELYRQFNKESKSVCYSSELGLVGNAFLDLNAKEDGMLSLLSYANETSESVSERMRLFYVALTRAEEMVVLLNRKPKEGMTFEDITPYSVENANSFQGFFLSSGLFLDSSFDTSSLPQEKVDNASAKIVHKGKGYVELRENVGKKGKAIATIRASHELSEPLDPAILVRGNRLHKIMEYTSFSKKVLPPIEDKKEKRMFESLLSLPLFKDASRAKEYHEYEFVDEEENLHGIIDMFLLYDDHIDLIDFKTKTIDPSLYAGQLKAYERYLSKVFKGKRIDKYLLSITLGAVNRVD
ncbi:MAG: UvrD-helicase domain-containing protein [Bacilli bacterium]|nr:UvrD-helicase domain-containing protein [Bacilli bacterium]